MWWATKGITYLHFLEVYLTEMSVGCGNYILCLTYFKFRSIPFFPWNSKTKKNAKSRQSHNLPPSRLRLYNVAKSYLKLYSNTLKIRYQYIREQLKPWRMTNGRTWRDKKAIFLEKRLLFCWVSLFILGRLSYVTALEDCDLLASHLARNSRA